MYDCRIKRGLCVECLVAAMIRSIGSSMIEHAHMELCKKLCANGEIFGLYLLSLKTERWQIPISGTSCNILALFGRTGS